jgi:hypothetical protein
LRPGIAENCDGHDESEEKYAIERQAEFYNRSKTFHVSLNPIGCRKKGSRRPGETTCLNMPLAGNGMTRKTGWDRD